LQITDTALLCDGLQLYASLAEQHGVLAATAVAQIPLGSSRRDTFDFVEPVEQVDMADDERSCTSLVVFMLLHIQILFVSSNKIN